ncbi:hypothetical protein BKA66DRAFT_440761 [Pyrenochaeta sp. MPI-SDFR-AT-0127]|nr:hypothetical protein BKA66DRAFT_440761 [Pyrenochaeta sp. MPI-SDFR-AT-0127]
MQYSHKGAAATWLLPGSQDAHATMGNGPTSKEAVAVCLLCPALVRRPRTRRADVGDALEVAKARIVEEIEDEDYPTATNTDNAGYREEEEEKEEEDDDDDDDDDDDMAEGTLHAQR